MRKGEAVAEESVTCVLGHAWQEGRILCPACGFGRRTQPAMDHDGHDMAAQTITAVVAMPASRDHEVGATAQRSPDGHWAWDGDEWVPANLTTMPPEAAATVAAGHVGDDSVVRTLVAPGRGHDFAPDAPPPLPMTGPPADSHLAGDEEAYGDAVGDPGQVVATAPTFDDLTAMLALTEDAEVDGTEQPLVSWTLLDEGEVEARTPGDHDAHSGSHPDAAELTTTAVPPEEAAALELPRTESSEPSQLERLAQQLALDPLSLDGADESDEQAVLDEPAATVEFIEPAGTVETDTDADADADSGEAGTAEADTSAAGLDARPVGRSRQARRRQRRAAAQRAGAALASQADVAVTAPVAGDTDLDNKLASTAVAGTPEAPEVVAGLEGAHVQSAAVEVDDAKAAEDDPIGRRRIWEHPLARVAVIAIAAAISSDIATGSPPLGHHHHGAAVTVADATVSRALSEVAVLETRYALAHGVATTGRAALIPGGYAPPAGVELLVAPATGRGFCLVGDRSGSRSYQSWRSGQGLVVKGGSVESFTSLATAEQACSATGSYVVL